MSYTMNTRRSLFATLALSCLVLVRYYRNAKGRHPACRPPSPRSLPLFGNLFSIPPGIERKSFIELGKRLNSDIIFLRLFSKDILVLNSAQAASDLLDKRSALYSDRPCPPMIKDPTLFDWSASPTAIGYNDLWRHYRRMMNNWLNARAINQFQELQERQTRQLLKRLLEIPANISLFQPVQEAILFTMASTMFRLAYGYHLSDIHDPFLEHAELALRHMGEAGLFTNFLVNIFPFMTYIPDWMPGTGWKRTAREWRGHKEQAVNEPFAWAKAQIGTGVFEPSILSALLQDSHLTSDLSSEERDARLKELAMALFLGGTDTTSTVLVNFVAAMVLNPHVQEKAEEEIDTVLGPATLPTMSDRDRLPYVRRLIWELLRWRPVLPTAIPHSCFQDDNYRGYDIQEGTIVIGNIWAMTRDELIYKDPEVFDPDRFLDQTVPAAPVFGWGRRICPGNHFAEASLFIAVTSLLATFNFFKKKDAHGEDIVPKFEDKVNSAVMELEPFEFDFRPRSEKHRELILESA